MAGEPARPNRKLRSRVTVDGLDRTPHRAFLRGMGLSDEDIAKPFIGVVSISAEVTPCNLTLPMQADAAKEGGFMGFGAQQVSDREEAMLNQVRAAVSG